MSLAYLITAYNNPLHLNNLIQALDSTNVDFFIHIDKKSTFVFDIPKKKNIHVLKDNIDVYLGGFSFIEAVFKLINEARNTKYFDYFILISGTDYPVRSNKYIKEFLESNNGTEFINLSKMPNNDKPFHRVEYFYLENELNFKFSSLIKRIINRLIRILHIKRKLPNKYKNTIFFGGSNWWGLSNKAIEYIMLFIDQNPEFINFFRNTLIPEESFFHTIIGNSKFIKKVDNSFVFTEWAENHSGHPNEISEKHLILFKHNEIISPYGQKLTKILFARKFSDRNIHLLKIIDKKYRL